jgi:hypothetical protein
MTHTYITESSNKELNVRPILGRDGKVKYIEIRRNLIMGKLGEGKKVADSMVFDVRIVPRLIYGLEQALKEASK